MSDTESRRRKAAQIKTVLETEGDTVKANTAHFNDQRYDRIEEFEQYETARANARAIKENAIEQLPDLIERVKDTVTANGGTVYVATDAADAREYVAGLVESDATVVKSKSMTTEEIDLNERLAQAGADVWETDLGEFVIQVADEAPSHIVGPSLHKSREQIADLFNDQFDPDEPLETAEELTDFAREFLGEHIRGADIGITGANGIATDSGTIMLVTNEGNARKSAVTPDTHVAIAGVEKLVPSIGDFDPFVELIAKAATGQDIPQYLTLLTPPVETPTLDFQNRPDDELDTADERSFHLVLIDNGRLAMRDDPALVETLYCIRCGACSNSCSNFQHVGGHAFGGKTYSGGIATGWEAGIDDHDPADANDLCTGCSRCVNNCPVKIDIPWINTVVRDRRNREETAQFDWLVEGLTPDEEPGGIDARERLFGNFETLATIGSATAPVSNWVLQSRPVKALLERTLGIDRRRSLPTFERETLREWFDARGGTQVTEQRRDVILYPDVYTNYIHTERGKAAVRTLEALGVAVHIPAIPASGRAPLSQGMISTARTHAAGVADALDPHFEQGRDVVVIEPSDIAMFEREYERLLPAPAYERLRDQSYEVLEYVYGLLATGADTEPLARGDRVAYHSHCQQRTLGLDAYTEAVFASLDFDVVTSDIECCGMAGSFGYKQEYYDLSADIGADLRDEFTDINGPITASGTSCLEQLQSVFETPVKHPIEVIAPMPNRNH